MIAVTCDDDCYTLRVIDQGEGIDTKVLPYVFEEFAHQDIDHHSQGHGLNLAIARQVILAHNGTISVQSAQGSGTTFTVRLPVSHPNNFPLGTQEHVQHQTD